MLKIYSTHHCPVCHSLQSYLKSKDIPFTSVDVLNNPEALAEFEKLGLKSVPVTTNSLGSLVFGFNMVGIKELIEEEA